jgi:hypothetical protein
MAKENPFPDSEAEGDAWEQGYLSAFVNPDSDAFPPFAPQLFDIYKQGEQAGREDRLSLPPEVVGEPEPGWVLEALEELGKEAGEHWLSHKFFHLLFKRAGGLVSLVVTVIGIPGDVQLRPLEPDWTGPIDQPEDTYVAVCPRSDHSVMTPGTTGEGYWTGQGHKTYGDAFGEVQAHGHAEGFVALCSLAEGATEGTCGPAWSGGVQ